MSKDKGEIKLYLYYIAPPGEKIDTTRYLYAYTDKKRYAESFEETRDMSLFIKKTKYIDGDDKEYKLFREKYVAAQLCRRTLKTCNDGIQSLVELVITNDEDVKTFTSEDKILEYIANKTEDLSFLKSKYLKIMNNLNYFTLFMMKANEQYDEEVFIPKSRSSYFYDGMYMEEDAGSYDIKVDQLATFIYFFGKTLKK